MTQVAKAHRLFVSAALAAALVVALPAGAMAKNSKQTFTAANDDGRVTLYATIEHDGGDLDVKSRWKGQGPAADVRLDVMTTDFALLARDNDKKHAKVKVDLAPGTYKIATTADAGQLTLSVK